MGCREKWGEDQVMQVVESQVVGEMGMDTALLYWILIKKKMACSQIFTEYFCMV